MDIAIHDQGSVVGFAPRTQAGRTWCKENIQDTMAMACAGRPIYWADHRPAQDIINGMQADGLVLAGGAV